MVGAGNENGPAARAGADLGRVLRYGRLRMLPVRCQSVHGKASIRATIVIIAASPWRDSGCSRR